MSIFEKTRENPKLSQNRIIPLLFSLICTAIYVSLVFNENVWLDEAFSASIIRCGFRDMLIKTFSDTLPPFYNISAWAFTHIFGFSTVILKVYSVIPMLLLMTVSAYFIPKIASVRSSCLFIVMITVMPHFLEHGVEIRMYSWAVLFAASTAIFAICYLQGESRTGRWLVVCTVLGAYTHQYALIAEAFVWIMLLFGSIRRHTVKEWGKMAAVCIICYIPCAILTVYQLKAATAYFSAEPVSFGSFLSSVRYPFVTNFTILSATLMTFTFLLLCYSISKGKYMCAYLFLIYIFVTAISFAIMIATGSTFFSSRYLMPSIAMLWLGASLALDMLLTENRYVWMAAIPLVLAVFVVIYLQQYHAEYVDLSEFMEFIDSTGEEDGYVIFEEYPEIEICLGYYAPWLRSFDIDDIGEINGRKFIFVNREMHTDDIEKIKIKNYELKYVENLSFDRYNFKAYELIRFD